MLLQESLPQQSALQRAISEVYLEPEKMAVAQILSRYPCSHSQQQAIQSLARELVLHVQAEESDTGGMEAFMRHYDLSSEEGVMMMCLAEALLRIPDKETEDLLIRDKLTSANWQQHIGNSHSSFVNMTTWGLALTGKVLDVSDSRFFLNMWQKLIKRSGEPVIRTTVRRRFTSKDWVFRQTFHLSLFNFRIPISPFDQAYRNGFSTALRKIR